MFRPTFSPTASQREIGAVLFGEDRVLLDWGDRSESLRSHVRRLVRDARAMARGGYRQLMRGSVRQLAAPESERGID